MGIFKRRVKTAETSSSLDEQTLRAVSARSDLSLPRDWVHYIYCADEAGAQVVAIAAVQNGWELERVGVASPGYSWVVIAEQTGVVVTRERVQEARIFFEHLAASVPGGDYDGWEASI